MSGMKTGKETVVGAFKLTLSDIRRRTKKGGDGRKCNPDAEEECNDCKRVCV